MKIEIEISEKQLSFLAGIRNNLNLHIKGYNYEWLKNLIELIIAKFIDDYKDLKFAEEVQQKFYGGSLVKEQNMYKDHSFLANNY